MNCIKQAVNAKYILSDGSIIFDIIPDRSEMAQSYYEHPIEIGMFVEYENVAYKIIDVTKSTPNIVGGRTIWVKVKQLSLIEMNDQIIEFLNSNFHKIHKNPCTWVSYTSYDEDPDYPTEPMLNLTKSHAHKDLAHIKIYYFGLEQSVKLELRLMSYCEWESFFEGYISSLNDLKFIMDCIGIPHI